jgi:hypothetical protein
MMQEKKIRRTEKETENKRGKKRRRERERPTCVISHPSSSRRLASL